LTAFFRNQGDTEDEAESTAFINLIMAHDDETHLDELLKLLNKQVSIVIEKDSLLELHIYILKQAMMMQKPEPSYEAVWK
jgi:hypothetical protein